MFDPLSTYRIQFHKDFSFRAFEEIIPYLQQLGIATVYASPIFTAVPGSVHGYDVTDANSINPEIGTLDQLYAMSKKLKEANISWLQDIVPNHMALHRQNAWLADVLAHGAQSPYSAYFDIDWDHPSFTGKLMLPILGSSLHGAISNKDIKLTAHAGTVALQCYDAVWPLRQDGEILKANMAKAGNTAALLKLINNDAQLLVAVLDEQHYVLCHWQATDKEINYRRFFTVNGLISLNMQHEQLFNEYHALIAKLCADDIFQGVRVDHIDGLYDPAAYLFRLRRLVGKGKYIVVEKILEIGEELPASWPIQGATGYEFLGAVNNVFTDHKNKKAFTKAYNKEAGEHGSYKGMLHEKKSLILERYMTGELDNLCRLALQLSPGIATAIEPGVLRAALGEFMVQCPVYKYYGDQLPLRAQEAQDVKEILAKMIARNEQYKPVADMLEKTLLHCDGAGSSDKALYFYKRCMQFTSPLMAKGVEDTLMYTYNRFIGHNEVGDSPHAFGSSAAAFHNLMLQREEQWPAALNATATHDTKRGEDARARLNAITEVADEWIAAVKSWNKINDTKDSSLIDSNDAYFIYQAMLASYPMPGSDQDSFSERFKSYMQKALREAKVHSTWEHPGEQYEHAIESYIDRLLLPNGAFMKSFSDFHSAIADAGIINSLAQVILKFTAPGVPDTYQGTELWDLSMVDPDNRRPVDYTLRSKWLQEINGDADSSLPERLWAERSNGKIKLWLTNHLLRQRAAGKALFSDGQYMPLEVKGKHKHHILAFARKTRSACSITIVPLQVLSLARKQDCAIIAIDWKDTEVVMPANMHSTWTNIVTGKKPALSDRIAVKDVFATLPMAVLTAKPVQRDRSAGVLMPLFSLPAPFGIGDFGPDAFAFIDFLAESGQKYWQLLPLNPTQQESAHSPYSSLSGMASNTLFISPQLLADEGLLTAQELEDAKLELTDKIDYDSCEELKTMLLCKAYNTFLSGSFTRLSFGFQDFCERQSCWLDDYALFVVVKQHNARKPWYEWPAAYKDREKKTLDRFAADNAAEIREIKWLQYVANEQWDEVRRHARRRGIKLFGDMPFYMSYDSADVWADREMFSIDKDGKITGIAGVPPDYFSNTGQLWGMPTYKWHVLKQEGYKWWVGRLKRNFELFDVVRLDHFRAFESYWEVPAGEETAVNGKWVKGPGIDFFNAMRDKLGSLPFIAEDLGYEMEAVYALREQTGLPGMKVLEFAWGDSLPTSVDAPHNYTRNCVVYTGTHDNNTVLGWYREEATHKMKQSLAQYTGIKPGAHTIAALLCRMAYSTVANIAILPIQDIMGYDEGSRINTPGSGANNWRWRLAAGLPGADVIATLQSLVHLYNR